MFSDITHALLLLTGLYYVSIIAVYWVTEECSMGETMDHALMNLKFGNTNDMWMVRSGKGCHLFCHSDASILREESAQDILWLFQGGTTY